ncbi:MAG TPA: hypothetical protein VL356_01705 [Acidocella sp.]|jgi:hypothetical protein|nr:hypothetical protein [Acidocella sp.]
MAALSTYLANKLIDHIRGVASYTMPTVYLGLATTTPTASTPGTEPTYTGYARVPLAGLLAAASAESGSNSSVINFGTDTSGSATIVAFQTWDAATGGNMLEFAPCSLSVSTGITPQFAVGAFTTTMS